jgi:large subunit ribosomal protein L29
MKANELRIKSETELKDLLIDQYREQFNLKMQKATGQLSKPDLIRRTRRNIARINTILAEKGITR